MYNNKLYCLHEAALPLECRMHRDGRLTYIGHETFDSALDYPFTAHPLKDGEDLLFHSYTTDETVR
jgi:carotenoid cleavage dioxygenase-like enzyme